MSSELDHSRRALPPRSPLRTHRFGDLEILARHAVCVDGDPRKVYCFDAREIEFTDSEEWVRPPASFDDDHDMTGLRAFWYPAESGDVVFYYLENMPLAALGDSYSTEEWTFADVPFDRLPPFGAVMTLFELHELAHWAIGDSDEQPGVDDTDHWKPWNRVLADVVGYVWDGDLEWFHADDADLWRVDETENGVRTPVGTWLNEPIDESESEQTTLEGGW